jgi:hypothetical protein
MSFDQLVRSCLCNWLGYGNPNGSIWFMGMEEGGAEIWREGIKTQTLESSLQIRSKFTLAMDFKTVWEDYYGISLESFIRRRGSLTTWHFMAAFLLSLGGEKPNTNNVRDFVFGSKKLGSIDSNHFLCEFLPLPRTSNDSIKEYQSIWPTNNDYLQEVAPRRFELIRQTLLDNPNVEILVSYDKLFTNKILDYFPSTLVEKWSDAKKKEYFLYKSRLQSNRFIYILATPFFGQGQANYEGLFFAVKKLNEHKGLII